MKKLSDFVIELCGGKTEAYCIGYGFNKMHRRKTRKKWYSDFRFKRYKRTLRGGIQMFERRIKNPEI